METRHSDHDGSDIFWPGYVDATTNLILNLLFLLTILIVAVFMFALELGRTSQEEPEVLLTAAVEQVTPVASLETPDLRIENSALKLELQRLKALLAAKDAKLKQAEDFAKVFEVSASVSQPSNGLEQTLASNFEFLVRFKDDAVVLAPEEHDQLLESLQPVLKSKQVSLYVEVPVGFTEAKRMGFYRAMAVRNLLIEMKLPTEKMNVSVVEGTTAANASVVRIRSY